MKLSQIFPLLQWLPGYRRSDLKGDLSAGLTVGVMLIPQGMAYAMIAGLPPIYGLYASTVPLVIYALLGTSRQLAVGPVAMVSLLTATGIGAIADGGTELYIALAIALALWVGLIQLLLGMLRLGFLVNFLSHPVISGFTSAAALIIGLSQLKHLLGVDLARSHHVHEIVMDAIRNIEQTNLPTLGIGLGGILLIVGIRRINKAIPGALLAVAAGILAMWAFGLTAQGVKIVGLIPQGLPPVQVPSLHLDHVERLIPVALTIALVGFMESFAVAKALQAKHRSYKVLPNQELIALGAANIGGAFFQSYPTTGGFSRTAVNDQAGAKTGLASIVSAALIVLTLLFLTPLFHYLPNAILAAVIMVAVAGLIDIREARYLWKSNRTDFWMLVVTFLATLSLGIEQGIAAGVVLSLIMVIYRTTRPHVAVLGQVPGTGTYRNKDRFQDVSERPDLLILRFDAQLYFANTQYFRDRLSDEVTRKGTALKAIVINAESINNMDSSALHMLDQVIDQVRAAGLEIYFSGVKGPVRDALRRSGLMPRIGEGNMFLDIQDAVDWHDRKVQEHKREVTRRYVLQTNG